MDDPEINAFVRRGLTQEWSPEQITGRLQPQHPDAPAKQVSAQTIYTWIDQDDQAAHGRAFLRRRGKRPARRKNKPASVGAPIDQRPAVIEERERWGDFEGDTVLGPPGTGGLAGIT